MTNIKFFVVMLNFFTVTYSFAQEQSIDSLKIQSLDEVVLIDSRFELKKENSGKVITTITQKELQHLQGKTLAEIINAVSGIEINGVRSNAAQNLSYFVRGGRNRQVLILIDGLAVSDPSQISNDYDLRLLDANLIESIEVLKGASSTLYGSGAATAVINITLKKPKDKPIAATFKSSLGTNQNQENDTYRIEQFANNAVVNGRLKKIDYSVGFGHQFTDGLSAVAGTGNTSDVFNSYNGHIKLGHEFSEAFKVSTFASLNNMKADFDDGFTLTDTNNQLQTKQYHVGLSSEYKYNNNGNITANLSYSDIERDVFSNTPAQFNAKSYVADFYNKYVFNNNLYTVLGLNFQEQQMNSSSVPFGSTAFIQDISSDMASFTITDPYINAVYISDFGLTLNAGLRLNNHSEYGTHIVYSLNPSYKTKVNFGYFKVLASYSTAYITPSLYQLFEPTFGNPELEPEENRTIEIGVEFNVAQKARWSLVYFNRKEDQFIDFKDLGGSVFQYNNINETFTARGFEFETFVNIGKKIQINVNTTYTEVDEKLNLRIPEVKMNTKIDYKLSPKTVFSVSYQYVDNRKDAVYNATTFATESIILPSYSLVDVYASHRIIHDKLQFFVNLTNAFNENYNELFGYSTKGRNITTGFSLTF